MNWVDPLGLQKQLSELEKWNLTNRQMLNWQTIMQEWEHDETLPNRKHNGVYWRGMTMRFYQKDNRSNKLVLNLRDVKDCTVVVELGHFTISRT